MPTLNRMTDESHPHELVWKESVVPFKCDGCKELGFGYCFQCPREDCNFILHEKCALRPPSPCIPFLNKCDLKFHRKNPLRGTRICDACALDIQGFLYQCSCEDADFHPCCTDLPPTIDILELIIGIEMRLHLHQKMKSKCLKCGNKKRSSGKVQGWGYVSSDGNFSYHVACMKETWFEYQKKRYFQVDQVAVDVDKWNSLTVRNQAPKEVIRRGGGKKSKAKKTQEWLMMVLKLLFSAIFGDPLGLISSMIQISQNI